MTAHEQGHRHGQRRAGAGEPVLLIHPFTMNHQIWRRTLEDLAADHDVLAVTLPGHHGGGPLSPGGIRSLVDAVEEMLDEVGWDSCHVAGNSLGGWVALELARRGRTRTVTAIAPAGGWTPWTPHHLLLGTKFVVLAPFAVAGGLLGVLPTRLRPVRRLALRLIAHRPDLVDLDDARAALAASTRCAGYLRLLLPIGRDAFRRHEEITVPVNLLLCEKDLIVPPRVFGRPFADLLPDVVVTTLLGVGHVPMLEAPAEVAASIREHIGRHTLRADRAG